MSKPATSTDPIPGPRSPHFIRAWSFGLLSIASPFLVPFVARLIQPGAEVGRIAYLSALGAAAAVSLLGVIFAVLTQRQTAPKTLQRRIAGITGALSGVMLLFWFVSTLALLKLSPSWR
ncbi:MAG TPA: hypothetical protein VNP73_10335 [Actinomycetota bacterium]|nr:hypothetical protein [Actinomycetota bacterium]